MPILRKVVLFILSVSYSISPIASWAMDDKPLPEIHIYSDISEEKNPDGEMAKISKIVDNRLNDYLNTLGLKHQNKLLPFTRIINNAPSMNNALIPELIRTSERENDFHWLLPIHTRKEKIYLFARNDLYIENKSRQQILTGNYRPICQTSTAQCALLIKFGFKEKDIIKVSDVINGKIENLILRGRADLTIDYSYRIKSNLNILNLSEDELIPIMEIELPKVYVAASKNIDPRLLKILMENRTQHWNPNFKPSVFNKEK